MDTITLGKHNPLLMEVRKAIENGELTADGLLPVEGPKLIREAQEHGLEVAAVLARRDASLEGLASAGDVYTLDAAAFKKIQSTETSQGLIGLVRVRKYGIADITRRRNGPVVVLARLQDPGNVGSIFRIAESFGAAGCVGLTDTASPYNPKAVRASAGSILRLPHVWDVSPADAAAALRSESIPLVGASPGASSLITEWNWRSPVALLIGQEGSGLAPDEARLCQAVLRIPHATTVESLNSAVAAAIILYEAFRQRGFA